MYVYCLHHFTIVFLSRILYLFNRSQLRARYGAIRLRSHLHGRYTWVDQKEARGNLEEDVQNKNWDLI